MNKNLILITLAVFSIAILLSQSLLINVHADLQFFTLPTSGTNGAMSYASSSSIHRYVVHNSGATYRSINPVDNSSSILTLPTSTKTYQGLACDSTFCYTTQLVGTGSASDRILTFNPITGAILSNVTWTASGVAQTENNENKVHYDGKGGIWISLVCTSASGRILWNIDGHQIGVCGGSTFGPSVIGSILKSDNDNFYGVADDSSSGFLIVSASTLTIQCSAVVTVSKTTGLAQYSNNFYVIVSTTTINKYSTACASGTGISGTGLTDQFTFLIPVTSRNEFYVVSAGNVAVMNLTSTNISTKLYGFPFGGGSTANSKQAVYNTQYGQLAKAESGGSVLYIAQTGTFPSGQAGDNGQKDCSNPIIICSPFCEIAGNENLLRCVAEANGGSLFFGNQTNPFNPVGSTNTMIVGAFNLSNGDIKTNGVGYLFLAIALLLFNALWLLTVHYFGTRGVVVPQPLYVSALISLAIIIAFVLIQWTDPLILILAVVALVVLASPRLISMVRGGGMNIGDTS